LQKVEMFANTIAAQKNVTKEQATEMLMQIRQEFYERLANGETPA